MKFEEYEFDATRLWGVRKQGDEDQPLPRLTKRSRAPRDPAAEVIPFPAVTAAPPIDNKACRRRTRAELRSIAMSLKTRDALRRGWIADRCSACRRCADMTDGECI